MCLGNFWPDLKSLVQAFVIDLEVTFLGDFVSWSLEYFLKIYLSIPLTDLVVVLNTMFIVFILRPEALTFSLSHFLMHKHLIYIYLAHPL